MCGIAGLVDRRGGRQPEPAPLLAMTTRLAHRGPDGQGHRLEPGVGLGHRRLAIIDLEGGVQPLGNEDGAVWVVFNGEIYNFQSLTAELEALGHRFATRSDTEVIVHAWESWGPDCVTRLQGMFALAVWDRNRQSLFLARDRLGIKPLYYTQTGDGWLLFASELPGLLAHPGCPRSLDPLGLEDYLAFGYLPDPRTIYQGVHKLEPGHRLLVEWGRPLPAPEPYWDWSFPATPDSWPSMAAAAAELMERLSAAVTAHLVADVPVGAFLSGGVDSAAVVALMSRAVADPRAITACTVAFREAAFDESPQAAQVARRFGVTHRLEQVEAAHFDLLETLVDLYGEPFADSSALPTWLVCRTARRQVKVVLSGDGGDEILAGYRRYALFMAEQRVRAWLPQGVRGPLFGTLGRLYPKLDWAPRFLRAKSTFQSLAREAVEGWAHGMAVLDEPLRRRLGTPALERERQGYRAVEHLHRHQQRVAEAPPLAQLQYLDLKTFLAGRVLVKVDRASMAHGLEVRVPLLDHRFVEWTARLPAHWKLRGGEGKVIFKEGLASLLPADLLRRPKRGFSIPLAAWLRGPLRTRVERSLLNGTLGETGWLEPRVIRELVEAHMSGRRDCAAALWALLMLEGFLRRA
ncbi:MAG: amidotransferase 1, exosortase A system-associated [Magnetococcales bacterium]|nr:amidotransferase 1, exosortase A system-associated [Magnetococcales bacterium]